jgi:hypothetical protein
VAKFDRVIPPGQEGTIEFAIDGNKVRGRFSKSAAIHTNDPKHPKMTITLSGTIKSYVVIEPGSRIFLKGSYDEPVTKSLTVYSNVDNAENPFAITRLESDIDDKITYKFEKTEEEGKYLIHTWKNPKLPVSNSFGSLFIYTNIEQVPKKVVQVQVTTKGDLIVRPTILNFGSVPDPASGKLEKPLQKTLTIGKNNGEFQIENITFSTDGYRAKIESLKQGKNYKVTVDFYPKSGGQNYMGEMVIHTTDPLEPTVKVRLLARLRR